MKITDLMENLEMGAHILYVDIPSSELSKLIQAFYTETEVAADRDTQHLVKVLFNTKDEQARFEKFLKGKNISFKK